MENDSQSRSITKWRAAATAYLEALTGLNVFCLQHELPVDGDMQQILHNQGIVYNPTRTAETLAPEALTQLQALQHAAEQRQQALDTLGIFAPEPGAEKEIKRLADTTAIEVGFGLQSMPRREWRAAATAYLEALTGLNVFCLQQELPIDGDMQQILHSQGIVYNPTRTAETLAPEAQTQLQALQHTAEQRKQALGTLAIFAPEPGAEKEIKRLADTTAIEVRFGLQSMPRRSWSQAVHSTISRAPADTGRGNG